MKLSSSTIIYIIVFVILLIVFLYINYIFKKLYKNQPNVSINKHSSEIINLTGFIFFVIGIFTGYALRPSLPLLQLKLPLDEIFKAVFNVDESISLRNIAVQSLLTSLLGAIIGGLIGISLGYLIIYYISRNQFKSQPEISTTKINNQSDTPKIISEKELTVDNTQKNISTTSNETSTKAIENPIDVLKLRLAKGEITIQQFEEMKKLLK